MQKLRRLSSVLALLLAAGCGGTGIPSGQAASFDFQLRVFPESFIDGGKARITAQAMPSGGGWTLELHAHDAEQLRGLLMEVDYAADEWTATNATSTGLLTSSASGTGPGSLELADLNRPGRAAYGEIVVHPGQQPGFDGSGVLARLEFARQRATAPPRSAGAATAAAYPWKDMRITPAPDRRLNMQYDLPGDYDQNGEVGITDLVPLSRHFRQLVPDEAAGGVLAVVDGNGDKEVNLADLTVIGKNLRRRAEYRVYRTREYSELPWDFAGLNNHQWPLLPLQLPLLASGDWTELQGDPAAERLWVDLDLDDEPGYFYVVAARSMPDAEWTPDLARYPDQVFQHVWADWELAYDADIRTLLHYPWIPGDCDRNTLVNNADMLPIAMNIGKTSPWEGLKPDVLDQIDADRNGRITTGDVFAVHIFSGQWCDGLNYYVTQNATDVPVDPYAPSTLEPSPMLPGEFDPPGGSYVWLRPAYAGQEGPCSEVLRIP